MSAKHPVIAITGSSGAGTSTVKKSFEHIFRRESILSAVIEGDSFHKYDREEMKKAIQASEKAGVCEHISHFGPEANLFEDSRPCSRAYGETGSGKRRYYLHNEQEAEPWKQKPGTFTPWEDLPLGTDCLFYEGLHGGVKTDTVDVARHTDLLVGVVPTVNLEWIQKIHRDTSTRGYSVEAVTGDHPAPHVRLRALHHAAVLAHPHQLPARAGGGHLQPLHRPRHPDAGRVLRGDPLPRPARRGLPLPADA
jgi:phosphoribulokinase